MAASDRAGGVVNAQTVDPLSSSWFFSTNGYLVPRADRAVSRSRPFNLHLSRATTPTSTSPSSTHLLHHHHLHHHQRARDPPPPPPLVPLLYSAILSVFFLLRLPPSRRSLSAAPLSPPSTLRSAHAYHVAYSRSSGTIGACYRDGVSTLQQNPLIFSIVSAPLLPLLPLHLLLPPLHVVPLALFVHF